MEKSGEATIQGVQAVIWQPRNNCGLIPVLLLFEHEFLIQHSTSHFEETNICVEAFDITRATVLLVTAYPNGNEQFLGNVQNVFSKEKVVRGED